MRTGNKVTWYSKSFGRFCKLKYALLTVSVFDLMLLSNISRSLLNFDEGSLYILGCSAHDMYIVSIGRS